MVGFFTKLHRCSIYERRDHKFSERGQWDLECNTDFSQIEKRKKSTEVYLPKDWEDVVKEANLRKSFVTTVMKQKDFLNSKTYIRKQYCPIGKDREGNGLQMKDVQWMNFGWGEERDAEGEVTMQHHSNEVWIRYDFNTNTPRKKVRILKPDSTTQTTQTL